MAFVEWLVASPPPRPTVFATIQTDQWNLTTESTYIHLNLAVFQHSILILSCIAGYPIFWHKENQTDLPEQTRTYNPFLREEWTFGIANFTNFSVNTIYEIPPIDRYEANITFTNFTAAMEGSYYCLFENIVNTDDLKTTVNLSVRTKPNSTDSASVIQGSFDTERPQPAYFFRYWTTKLSIPFIYTVPPNLTVSQAITTTDPNVEWALPKVQEFSQNTTFRFIKDFLTIEQKMLSPTLAQTTFIITRGSYFHKGYCDFILRTLGKDGKIVVKKESFYLWLDTIEYDVEDAEQLTPLDASTLLTIHRVYEIRLYYSNPDWTNPRLIVQEQEQQKDASCLPKRVQANQSDDICGMVSFSHFSEQSSERGLRMFMYVKKACILTVLFDSEHENRAVFPSISISALDPEVFGDDRGGAKLIADPKPENGIAFTDESITLKCLMPKCHQFYLSWCADWCQWPPFNFNNDAAGGFVGQMAHANVTFSQYNENTVSSDAYFSPLTLNYTGDYACGLLAPSSRKQHIVHSGKLNLTVKQPRPPFFADGRNYTTLHQSFKEGSSLPLLCKVDGLPKPSITWSWKKEGSQEYTHGVSNDSSTFEVDQPGVYVCNASSRYGWNSRTYVVKYDRSYLPFAVAIPITVLICVMGAMLIWWIRRRAIEASFKELAKTLETPSQIIPVDDTAFLNDQVQFLQYKREEFEIDRSRFTLTSKLLGSGEFGCIHKGELKVNGSDEIQEVAIKTPRDSFNLQQFRSLADELKIMSHIRPHVNVLALVGACTHDIERRQLFVLTEFCENGSLKDYLNKNFMKFEGFAVNAQGKFLGAPGAVEALLKYAYQAANGMAYLAAENIIHRDLALRNLLLTGSHIVKICDFGMSRQHANNTIYKKKLSEDVPVPIFWMALESLAFGQYSKGSDVWSFGVVLWEMFSCGKRPYPNHAPDPSFREWLMEKDTHRMGPPNIACDEIYQLMQTCWKADPDSRPSFSECKRIISRILEQRSPSVYQSMVVTLSDAWLTTVTPSRSKISDATCPRTPATLEDDVFAYVQAPKIEISQPPLEPWSEEKKEEEEIDESEEIQDFHAYNNQGVSNPIYGELDDKKIECKTYGSPYNVSQVFQIS